MNRAQEIIKAIKDAQVGWTGLEWTTQAGPLGLDLDGVSAARLRRAARAARERKTLLGAVHAAEQVFGRRLMDRHPYPRERDERAEDLAPPAEIESPADLAEALEEAAAEVEEVEASAQAAAKCGDAAIEALRRGDLDAARAELERACAIEREYGDCPEWRAPLRLLEVLEAECDNQQERKMSKIPDGIYYVWPDGSTWIGVAVECGEVARIWYAGEQATHDAAHDSLAGLAPGEEEAVPETVADAIAFRLGYPPDRVIVTRRAD